ncbi:hypothetical protein K488DRAFT_60659, partial [Vararia minispora EC-137]
MSYILTFPQSNEDVRPNYHLISLRSKFFLLFSGSTSYSRKYTCTSRFVQRRTIIRRALTNLPQAWQLATDGTSLLERAMTTLEPGVLNAAISSLQESVSLTPDGHPDKPSRLNNLGNALQTRFSRLGGLDDLESAIVVKREAVDLTPDSHPDKPACLNNLGNALETRFSHLGSLDDLESAIVFRREAVDLTPDGHPDKPGRLINLGFTLQIRFRQSRNPEDLEKYTCTSRFVQRRTIIRGALTNLPQAWRLATDGTSLLEQAMTTLEPGILNAAISCLQNSVDLTPNGHPEKPAYLNNLGIALQTRFDRLGSLDDLESGIVVNRKAVDLTPDGHPDKPGRLNNLGNALQAHFSRLGSLDDLEEAHVRRREAVDLTPDGHPDKPGYLNNLGNALEARFGRLGSLDDLESAIVVKRKAVDLTPDGHPEKPACLNNLGNALEARFERLGGLDDLESAIVVKHKAVDLTPDGHPDKPSRLNNLGNALEARFDRLGCLDDLESAIVVKRKAIDLTPDGHPDKPSRLNNLGNALEARFDRLGCLDDLESAIVVKRKAVDLTPDGHPDKPSQLNNLGNALQTRFDRLGGLDDLESAIVFRREAVDLTPDGHPDKPGRLINLGFTLQIRFRQSRNPEDLELACDAFTSAINQETGPPSVRFDAIRRCTPVRRIQIQLGYATYQDLMNTFNQAFNLIPQVAWLGTSISQRYAALSSIGKVVSHAVSIAIQTGNLSRAIEWLDEGRSVVWGQLLQLRSPVDDLRNHHPDLADKLQSLSHSLEVAGHDRVSENYIRSGRGSDAAVHDQVSARVKLAQDYQSLLRQIRDKDGFKSFLLPKTLVELIPPQRTDGPVVIINVHQLSDNGDALVVYGSAEPIVHVPLPKLTFKLAEGLRLCITQSLKKAGVRMREASEDRVADSADPPSPDDRGAFAYKLERSANSQIADALEVLWLCIIQPILERIEDKLAESTIAHITWCPMGPLAFLPIHAAGIYGRQGMPGERTKLPDIAVSSYTPTLSALLRPPHMFADGWSSMNALIVSQPDTPDMSKLPGVLSEVAQIE